MKPLTLTLMLLSALAAAGNEAPDTLRSNSPRLDFYLQAAADNNPALQSAFLDYQAALQQVPQMGAWQDPQLEIGFFLQPMDLVGGRQLAQAQLMQMFPWFGTRRAARTEAMQMAQMAFEQFRAARNTLFLEVYTQWYALCALQERLANSRQNLQLLRQLETLAISQHTVGSLALGSTPGATNSSSSAAPGAMSAAVPAGGMNMGGAAAAQSTSAVAPAGQNMSAASMGSGMSSGSSGGMAEVLRLQIEMAELESNIATLLSERETARVRFSILLGGVEVPQTWDVPAMDSLPSAEEATPESEDLRVAASGQLLQHPMLAMLRAEASAYQARQDMQRRMGYPMLGIGLQYMLIGKSPTAAAAPAPAADGAMAGMDGAQAAPTATSGSMSMNGKDMVMPMVAVTIPVFRGKYRAAQKQAQLQQQASHRRLEDALNTLLADLHLYQHQLRDLRRKIALYRHQASLSQSAYNLMLQQFTSGKSALSEVIQVQRQLLDYRLKESEAIAAHNTMAARIQLLIVND